MRTQKERLPEDGKNKKLIDYPIGKSFISNSISFVIEQMKLAYFSFNFFFGNDGEKINEQWSLGEAQ